MKAGELPAFQCCPTIVCLICEKNSKAQCVPSWVSDNILACGVRGCEFESASRYEEIFKVSFLTSQTIGKYSIYLRMIPYERMMYNESLSRYIPVSKREIQALYLISLFKFEDMNFQDLWESGIWPVSVTHIKQTPIESFHSKTVNCMVVPH